MFDWNTNFYMRKGTAAEFEEKNPVLSQGEFGLETDTNKAKLGNGQTNWNELDYLGSGSGLPAVEGSGKAMVSVNGEWKEQDGYGYTEVGETLIVEEDVVTIRESAYGEFSVEGGYPVGFFPTFLAIKPETNYKVIFNDEIYAVESYVVGDTVVLGEINDEGMPLFDNYPFIIGSDLIENAMLMTEQPGTYSIKIIEVSEVTTSISPKYLPEGGFGYEENNTKSITWDGNREGKEHPTDPAWPEYTPEYFKVSDLTPTTEEIFGGIVKFFSIWEEMQDEITDDAILYDLYDDSAYAIGDPTQLVVIVIPSDEFTFTWENDSGAQFSLYFEKAGIYFFHQQVEDAYVSGLSYGENTIHKIDKKYLPDSDNGSKKTFFITNSESPVETEIYGEGDFVYLLIEDTTEDDINEFCEKVQEAIDASSVPLATNFQLMKDIISNYEFIYASSDDAWDALRIAYSPHNLSFVIGNNFCTTDDGLTLNGLR